MMTKIKGLSTDGVCVLFWLCQYVGMSPGTFMLEPESTKQFKAGYREGYEAGRAVIRRELKELLKTIKEKELSTWSSGTHTNLE